MDGSYHLDFDGETNTHGYNTRSRGKAYNVTQGDGPHKKPSRGSVKRAERNVCGLSHTPAELHKKQLDDLDIGPLLKWKESGNRPFDPEVCSASAASRHDWNYWGMLQIENDILMRHF